MDILKINWETTIEYCERLAGMIDFEPDVIVGISRGGLVPARILSDILGKRVLILGMEFYKGINERKDRPAITQELPKLEGLKILLVDDVSDSGKSLVTAMELLKGNKVKTATLHYKPHSSYKPDYFVETSNSWIVYPWEVHEAERKAT